MKKTLNQMTIKELNEYCRTNHKAVIVRNGIIAGLKPKKC